MLMPSGNDEEESFVVKRMTVSMEDELYEKVEALANEEQRTVPNLLVYLAAKAVKEREDGDQQQKPSSK